MRDDRTYCYRITWSAVDTVKVGTYLIDYEDGAEGDWSDRRLWTLWKAATGNFEDGWAGVRLDRLCTDCRTVGKAALDGHAEKCGEAPMYRPPVEATP